MFTENKIQFTIGVNIDDDEIAGVESMIRLLQELVENSKKYNATKISRKRDIKKMVTKIQSDSEGESEEKEVIEPIIEPVSTKVKNLLETMTKKVDGIVERDAPNCFTELKDGSVECKCGSIMVKKNIHKHKKTVKHKEWLDSQK